MRNYKIFCVRRLILSKQVSVLVFKNIGLEYFFFF